MVLMEIAGAIALILFGIRFLRKGLDRLAGDRMHHWVESMQQNRATALLAGFYGPSRFAAKVTSEPVIPPVPPEVAARLRELDRERREWDEAAADGCE